MADGLPVRMGDAVPRFKKDYFESPSLLAIDRPCEFGQAPLTGSSVRNNLDDYSIVVGYGNEIGAEASKKVGTQIHIRVKGYAIASLPIFLCDFPNVGLFDGMIRRHKIIS